MRKKKYLIIDVETCNTLDCPFVYDIGYCITDNEGNTFIRRSFMIAEFFLDNKDLLNTAYYKNKLPNYWKDYECNTRSLKSFWTVRKIVRQDIERYNVKDVYAYNCYFDRMALNNTIRYLSKSNVRYFFPYNVKFGCIWHMACQTIACKKDYFKFVVQNGLMSDAGNIPTNAETVYKYITNNTNFSESHTGLEDVEIEKQIFVKCIKSHKKMDRSIKRNCWQIPQKNKKKYKIA